MFELRSEIYCVERGGDATCGLAPVTKTGLVLVGERVGAVEFNRVAWSVRPLG
jgi:hypothetical protein